ncbi:MAG: hypothetical protein GY859_30000, partial [Desulfobacterales bacterium]|nr:hypothetical protein [Desulfobacterales bacterium]
MKEGIMKRNGLNALVLIMLFALIVLPNFGCAIAGDKSVSDAKKTNARESCPPCEKPTPETNAEIRLWYNHQVVIIPALDKR